MGRELRSHLQEITKFLLFRFTDKADEERRGEHASSPASSLSLSLIGMDKNSVTCLYKLHIFHFLVPSGRLKIIPSSGFV